MSENRIVTVPSPAASPERSGRSLPTASMMPSIEVSTSTSASPWTSSLAASVRSTRRRIPIASAPSRLAVSSSSARSRSPGCVARGERPPEPVARLEHVRAVVHPRRQLDRRLEPRDRLAGPAGGQLEAAEVEVDGSLAAGRAADDHREPRERLEHLEQLLGALGVAEPVAGVDEADHRRQPLQVARDLVEAGGGEALEPEPRLLDLAELGLEAVQGQLPGADHREPARHLADRRQRLLEPALLLADHRHLDRMKLPRERLLRPLAAAARLLGEALGLLEAAVHHRLNALEQRQVPEVLGLAQLAGDACVVAVDLLGRLDVAELEHAVELVGVAADGEVEVTGSPGDLDQELGVREPVAR